MAEEMNLAMSLPSLPGTAPPGMWRIADMFKNNADGRRAIFPIVKDDPPSDIDLVWTGFYLTPSGLFATAAHVARELMDEDGIVLSSAFIVHQVEAKHVFRPICKFFLHPDSDIAIGLPAEITIEATGLIDRAKALALDISLPPTHASIAAWAYPLHKKVTLENGAPCVIFQPTFYNGILQDTFLERGPSAKLKPPYCSTNIHLHGGASGAPIFNESGSVVAIGSTSYDGAEDFAFVTPIKPILDIEICAALAVAPTMIPFSKIVEHLNLLDLKLPHSVA